MTEKTHLIKESQLKAVIEVFQKSHTNAANEIVIGVNNLLNNLPVLEEPKSFVDKVKEKIMGEDANKA